MPEAIGKGALITLEGIDGTGKSTVAADLGRFLAAAGVRAAVQREPTQTWLGDAVKRAHTQKANALAHTFLFLADRAQHTAAIRDQMGFGAVVVCDRYLDSTVAYQSAALARETPPMSGDLIEWLTALHRPWAQIPDLTILIVDDPARCMERVKKARGHTSMFEDAGFLAAVQENYRAVAKREPGRFKVLESLDLAALQSQARQLVEDFLKARSLWAPPAKTKV
jgi:dTMP kinase